MMNDDDDDDTDCEAALRVGEKVVVALHLLFCSD